MKHNKRREYEQAPLGFLREEREERRREFRLEKWKKHQAFSLKKEVEGKGLQQTTLATHQGLYGLPPWRERIVE